jgi:phage RecT family recombinase
MTSTAAVVRTERSVAPYALRSPVAEILNKESARATIEPMLRPGDSYDRIIVEVFHAASNNADIMKCSPVSIVQAVAKAVSTGLVIGEGVHLVPFNTKLQAILDYKGRIELIVRSGAARHIDAHCVYEREAFIVAQGTNPSIDHRPIMDPRSRGPMIGAYAIAHLGHGRLMSVVLSNDEIEQVRQKYSRQWKAGELPYWYAQKTCVHRLAKLLPKNPALAQVIAMFEREDADELDPANEVTGCAAPYPPPTAYQLTDRQSPAASEDEKWEAPASVASEPAATPARSKAFLFPMPFGGPEAMGKPIGEFSPEDLESARRFARRKGSYQEFLDASDELLAEREQERLDAEDSAS